MGDAYRGLTIRIGADATPLTRVLKNINSASKQTARDLGKIGRALKDDPGSLALMEQRMRGLGDRTKATATEMALLAKTKKQVLSASGLQGKNLNDVLKESETRLANTRNHFNSVNQSLEKVKDSLIDYYKGLGMTEKESKKAMESLWEGANKVGPEFWRLKQTLQKVWEQGEKPFGAKTLTAAYEKLFQLRTESKSLSVELERLNEISGLRGVALQGELLKSSLKADNVELIKLENHYRQINRNPAIRSAANDMRLLAASVEDAENDVKAMDAAMKAMPESVKVAEGRMKALKQKSDLLERSIRKCEAAMKAMDSSNIARVEERYTTTANAVRTLTDQEAELRTKTQELAAALEHANNELDLLAKDGKATDRVKNEISELNAKLRITEDELIRVRNQLKTAQDAHAFREAERELVGLNAELAKTQAKMKAVKANWAQIGATIRTTGYSMLATVGSAALMAGMYSIQAAKDIDSAYRNMRKTVNGTEEQFEALKESALEFSQTHFTSADQILEIEAIGGQLGIQVENLQKFSEVVSNTDIATNLDVETIAQNFGQLSNIMKDMDQDIQDGPGSLEAYSDALVRLGNNAPAQEDAIENVMMRIASMGTISGMTTPDLLALATAIAATGQGAESSGTAISKTFSNIESAVNGSEKALEALKDTTGMSDKEIEKLEKQVAKGDAALKGFADVAGMSAEDFKKAWNEKPMVAFESFIKGLAKIDEKGGSVDSTLKNLGINADRQKRALMGLTNTVGKMDEFLMMSNDAWNGVSDKWGDAGDAAREAQRKSEGFSGELQKLTNNGQMLGAEITDSLTPAIAWLRQGVQDATSWFASLSDETKTFISVAGLTVSALGPALILIGSTIDGVASIANVLKKVGGAWNNIAKGETALGRLAGFIKGPWGIALGIGVAAIGNLAKEAWDAKVREERLMSVTERLGESFSNSAADVDKYRGALEKVNPDQITHIDEIDTYLSKQEELIKQIDELGEASAEEVSKLQAAAEIIEELGNKSDLSAEEQGKLSWALQVASEAAGEQYEATDLANGKLGETEKAAKKAKKAILELLEAKKLQAIQDSKMGQRDLKQQELDKAESHYLKLSKDYDDYWKDAQPSIDEEFSRIEENLRNGYITLEEVEKQKAAVIENYRKAIEDTEFGEQYRQAENDVEAVRQGLERMDTELGISATAIADNTKEVERFITEHGILAKALEYSTAAQEGMSNPLAQFQQDLNDSGISMERFADLNEMELAQVAFSYGGTVDSIIGALLRVSQGNEKACASVKKSKSVMVATLNDFKEKANGALDKIDTQKFAKKMKDTGVSTTTLYNMGAENFAKLYEECGGDIDKIIAKLKDLDNTEAKPTVKVEDDTEMTLQTITRRLNEFTNKKWAVHMGITYSQPIGPPTAAQAGQTGSAVGGFFPNAIAHASGYFVDKPTVVGHSGNVTHIAGEAGLEYVQRFASGGFGVMPLTNPKMRPWTTDIARQISGMGGGNTINLYLDYKAGADANQMARDIVREITRQIG